MRTPRAVTIFDHLLPIWEALPEERRGRLMVAHRQLIAHAETVGAHAIWATPQSPGPITLVAAHSDYTQVHHERPVAYVEHGAGQTYRDHDWHPSYSGGTGRDRVAMFLTLNETTAARERDRYPGIPVHVVGSTRLDALLRAATRPRPAQRRPVVAVAFHWDWKGVPETRESWSYWRAAVHDLAASGAVEVLGHGHPRIFAELARFYTRWGIEPVPDLADVVARADLICIDNTSAGPEFAAATGRPVLWLNASWYRRHVEHGGRFWDWPTGQVCCEEPSRLADAVRDALSDPADVRDARARMVDAIYPAATRGQAGRLAADAVLNLTTAGF